MNAVKAVVKKGKPSAEARVRKARQVATHAINNAAVIAADQSVNRSTRTRAGYKVKADALDRVAAILAGKE